MRNLDYSSVLKRNTTNSDYDKKIFEEWHRKKITTRECFEWFMKNNLGYIAEDYWDEVQFVKWLHSLGY